MTDTLRKRFEYPSSDVTPVFVTSAEPGNVVPALARLLIDRMRGDLTNKQKPIMLNLDKELPQWALN